MFKGHKTAKKEKNSVPFCPECHHPMVKRLNRFGGHFWGCIMYPKCKSIISIDPLPVFSYPSYEHNPHGWSDEDWHEYADSMGIDEGICWGLD